MAKFDKLDRLPPYVLAIVNELKARARRAGEDVVDLGFGNPNHPTPPHVVEKLVEAARDPRNHHYSASRGLPNLRRAMARWYQRRYGVDARSRDPGRSRRSARRRGSRTSCSRRSSAATPCCVRTRATRSTASRC